MTKSATGSGRSDDEDDEESQTQPLAFADILSDDTTTTSKRFVEACYLAAETGRPLYVVRDKSNSSSNGILLNETVTLRKRQRLVLVGISHDEDALHSHADHRHHQHQQHQQHPKAMITITGNLHSLFVLNNHAELHLKHIDLQHTTETNTTDANTISDGRTTNTANNKFTPTRVGAALQLRYKATVQAYDCRITSHCGFGVWAVHKSTVQLTHCEVVAPLRSAVVCFGSGNFYDNLHNNKQNNNQGNNRQCHDSNQHEALHSRPLTVTLHHCIISNAGVHAVCARGASHVSVNHCRLQASAGRALYAYAQATVSLLDTCICRTLRHDQAAVEVSARSGDQKNEKKASSSSTTTTTTTTTASITIQGGQIVDNAGAGLLLRGTVHCTIDDTAVIERNAGGNIVRTASLQDDFVTKKLSDASTGNMALLPKRGNHTGPSSFRPGDWWCPHCPRHAVVISGQGQCPKCQATFRQDYCLTIKEIQRLNRGQGGESIESPTNDNQNGNYQWYFDGDDRGWLAYDNESNQLLEDAFVRLEQLGKNGNSDKKTDPSSNFPLVLLSQGRYQVNVETMEQRNVASQFLRMVKRVHNTKI